MRSRGVEPGSTGSEAGPGDRSVGPLRGSAVAVRKAIRILRDEGLVDLVMRTQRYLVGRYRVVKDVKVATLSLLSRWVRALSDNVVYGDEVAGVERATAWRFGEREAVEIRSDRDLPYQLRKLLGRYESDRSHVVRYEDARLVGTEPIGISSDGRIVHDTVDDNAMLFALKLIDLAREAGYRDVLRLLAGSNEVDRSSRPRLDDIDQAFLLVKYPRMSYYHWVVEYLPKLRALEHYESETGAEPDVLVHADAPEWMIQSIELCGCDADRLVEWDRREADVRELVVPSHRNHLLDHPRSIFGDEFEPSPAEYRWLRERMSSNADDGRGEGFSSRIYVSRDDADRYRLANEPAVVDLLASRGFEAYTLSDLSVEDQVALFSQAEVVVGPHGSGLVNVIFSEDVHVIELFKATSVRGYFFALASVLGLEYDYVLCEPAEGGLAADLSEVAAAVDDALDADG